MLSDALILDQNSPNGFGGQALLGSAGGAHSASTDPQLDLRGSTSKGKGGRNVPNFVSRFGWIKSPELNNCLDWLNCG